MTTKQLLALIATAVFAAGALAADSATVGVSASVVGVCKYSTATGSVSFTLNPATGGPVSGTLSQPAFWCTKGASYTITDDNGLNESGTTHQMKHATLTEYIPYTFTYTATGTGSGKSTPITMNIAASVAESDYIDKSEGSYADTVTLSITP
jgi:spore coat protein U-like protein